MDGLTRTFSGGPPRGPPPTGFPGAGGVTPLRRPDLPLGGETGSRAAAGSPAAEDPHSHSHGSPSRSSEPVPIQLFSGDVLLLRGDCGHIGDQNLGDEVTHIIHGYLDSPVDGCEREIDPDTAEAFTFEFKGYPWQT